MKSAGDAHELFTEIRERNGNNRVLLLANAAEALLSER
jgi:hypothetical protein